MSQAGVGHGHYPFTGAGSFLRNHYLVGYRAWPAIYAGEDTPRKILNKPAQNAAFDAAGNVLWKSGRGTKYVDATTGESRTDWSHSTKLPGYSLYGTSYMNGFLKKLMTLRDMQEKIELEYIKNKKELIKFRLDNLNKQITFIREKGTLTDEQLENKVFMLTKMLEICEDAISRHSFEVFWAALAKFDGQTTSSEVDRESNLGEYALRESKKARAKSFNKTNYFYHMRTMLADTVKQYMAQMFVVDEQSRKLKWNLSDEGQDAMNLTIQDIAAHAINNLVPNSVTIDKKGHWVEDSKVSPRVAPIFDRFVNDLVLYFAQASGQPVDEKNKSQIYKVASNALSKLLDPAVIGRRVDKMYDSKNGEDSWSIGKTRYSVKHRGQMRLSTNYTTKQIIDKYCPTLVRSVANGLSNEYGYGGALAGTAMPGHSTFASTGQQLQVKHNAGTGAEYKTARLTDNIVFETAHFTKGIDIEGLVDAVMEGLPVDATADDMDKALEHLSKAYNAQIEKSADFTASAADYPITRGLFILEVNAKNWLTPGPTVMSDRKFANSFANLKTLFDNVNKSVPKDLLKTGIHSGWDYTYDKMLFLLNNTASEGMFGHDDNVQAIGNLVAAMAVGFSWDNILAEWSDDFGLNNPEHLHKIHLFQWNDAYYSASQILDTTIETLIMNEDKGLKDAVNPFYEVTVHPWKATQEEIDAEYQSLVTAYPLSPKSAGLSDAPAQLTRRWDAMRNMGLEKGTMEVRLRESYVRTIADSLGVALNILKFN